ncbi:MAG: DUF2254 domain-containing protein [Pseudomonadota bacterium]
MGNRLKGMLETLGDLFWLRPAGLVALGLLLASLAIAADRADSLPEWLSPWVYSGGEAGARDLLGAVASSTIGVAGTVFSITVAALSLASGQMGPRLLRNFTRDRGNQAALGIFLGTFAYALVVLRSVRSVEEGAFVPHLGVTGALLLALLCVGTLTWFVHHVANGINVDVVVDLVHRELSTAIGDLTSATETLSSPSASLPGTAIALRKGGHLRTVDEGALADWAAARGTALTLLVRPGAWIFPGVPVAEVADATIAEDATEAVASAFAIGTRKAAAQDLEFAVRQLVEVAVRALSPGISDPFTAMAVLDRLGSALCEVVPRHLPGNIIIRDGEVVLHQVVTNYDGLCDAMFHMIRQNAANSPAVLLRMLDVLGAVLQAERQPVRRATLLRHAELVATVGRASLTDPAALSALGTRIERLAESARKAEATEYS